MLKRLFDMALSAAGLIVLSPILAIIAIAVKMSDGGPIFYRGERVGKHGRLFRIFKFRTMIIRAEHMGGVSTAGNDPRITAIGHILRRCKLDELPQLVNVFLGQMSLVGPRPEVKQYTDMYTKEEKAILSVRPGITDWASIWNSDEGAVLANYEDPEKAYLEVIRPKKLALQLKYVHEQSIWTDIKILMLTVVAIARPESSAVQDVRQFRAEKTSRG